MLTQVQVWTAQGALLNLPLEDVSAGLVVEEIEGLDPVKATLVSSSFATMDGEQYQSSRRETRNIKLKLGLQPDYILETVRGLRSRLYGFFMPKSKIKMRFVMADGLEADISGHVESFETALFTKEPTVDISVICFDPDFYEPTPVVVNGTTTAGTTEMLVEYDGTVESGIEFALTVTQPISTFTIYHRPPDGTLRSLDFVGSLQAGDVLKIVTTAGSKSATLTRSGSDSSMLYGVSPFSNWIEFQPGDNYLRVYATQAGEAFTVTYTNKYGGL